jgi:hypothetical protein
MATLQSINFSQTAPANGYLPITSALPFVMNINGRVCAPHSVRAVVEGVKAVASPVKNDSNGAYGIINGAVVPAVGAGDVYPHNNIYKTFMNDMSGLTVEEKLIYDTLLCQATQHPALAKLLINAAFNDTPIVCEDTDPFWGRGSSVATPYGPAYNGANRLGHLYEFVGQKLLNELAVTGGAAGYNAGHIYVRAGISDGIANLLGHNSHLRGSECNGQIISYNELYNPVVALPDLRGQTLTALTQFEATNGNKVPAVPAQPALMNTPALAKSFVDVVTHQSAHGKALDALQRYGVRKVSISDDQQHVEFKFVNNNRAIAFSHGTAFGAPHERARAGITHGIVNGKVTMHKTVADQVFANLTIPTHKTKDYEATMFNALLAEHQIGVRR